MKIHVVCYDDYHAWILGKIARRLHAALQAMGMDVSMSRTSDPLAEINHHIIYDDWVARVPAVETVMITHIVNDDELNMVRRQLIDCGVDMGICMSSATVHQLAQSGVPRERLCFINPAQDGTMRPRQMVIGLTTRLYPDARKREHLLEELAESISPGDFRFAIMGGGWETIVARLRERGFQVEYTDHFDDAVYHALIPGLDYYLYLGNDEGSMGFLDALAAGVPTIVTRQGFHLDVPGGITYAFQDLGDLRLVFTEIAATRRKRMQSVSALTWPENARKHLLLWEYLLRMKHGRDVPSTLVRDLDEIGLVRRP
jgi:hypothetical protein